MELKDKLFYQDQDILNALYVGQVKYAEKIYNYQLLGMRKIPKDDIKQMSILHYTGSRKPWDYHCMDNNSKYYWKVRFAQGHRIQTINSYALAIMYRIYILLCDLKDLLF